MSDNSLAFPVSDDMAFPAAPGEDDAAASAQRNEQIQQGFDSQRFQRTVAQSMGSALAKQAAESAQQQREIAQLSAKRKGDQ